MALAVIIGRRAPYTKEGARGQEHRLNLYAVQNLVDDTRGRDEALDS